MSWLTAWPQETQGVIFGLLRGKRWGGGGQLPLLPSRMSSLCLEPALHPHPCFPPGPLQPIHSPSDISPQHTSDALPLTQALHASRCSKDAVHTCLGGSQGPSRPTGLPLVFSTPAVLQADWSFRCLNFRPGLPYAVPSVYDSFPLCLHDFLQESFPDSPSLGSASCPHGLCCKHCVWITHQM